MTLREDERFDGKGKQKLGRSRFLLIAMTLQIR